MTVNHSEALGGEGDSVLDRWRESRGRRIRHLVALAALVALATGLGFWAGSTVMKPPLDLAENAAGSEIYVVREGEVGRSVSVMATAEWSREPLSPWVSTGVLTSLDAVNNGEAIEGEVLFSVDLRPVVALHGDVPMFRDLGSGSNGTDVEQLQAALNRIGFFDATADGLYGSSTQQAVRSWQRSLGVHDDGVVRASDVVFVPALPAAIRLGEDLRVGSRLSPGQQLLWQVAASPTFNLVLPMDQGSLIEAGMAVEVAYNGGTWDADIATVSRSGDGREIEARLLGTSGMPVCREECAELVPVTGRSTYRAAVTLTPTTIGPVVPMAAIASTADGGTVVMLATGEEAAVAITEMADGLAVVSGIEVGTQILVPFPAATLDEGHD